ncbi:hypothetical protein T265_07119 [Opisthorchis viverrini]|uniref:Uncharacterized protein n=1 Tax=Opisthorchis viverrini TaxID=6198 RepID=A0A075ACH0_OPIVI|nr:hypothetical protein T265_07119 [Opisthorchis viverrini]KER25439.1 hypothetical protein T265_07119 [Opisthorchis viverrini]
MTNERRQNQSDSRCLTILIRHKEWDARRNAEISSVVLANFCSLITRQFFEKYTHLQINSVFMRDPTESLVYDILQLNALHTGRLMFHLARYSRYRSIDNLTVSQPSCFLRLAG